MSRTKRRTANLNPMTTSVTPPRVTQWLDESGVVRTTVHDGTFLPNQQGEPDYLCFTAEKAGATLLMRGYLKTESDKSPLNIEYSLDRKTFVPWEYEIVIDGESGVVRYDTLSFANVGDKVWLRGDNPHGTAKMNYNGEHNELNFDWFFHFEGDENSQTENNVFAVSGDLQTIKDKTGRDKVAGSFYMLFSGETSDNTVPILITSAPDLTATKLSMTSYCYLYLLQPLLATGSRMPVVTNAMLPAIEDEEISLSSMFGMYSMCSLLTAMPVDLSGIHADGSSSSEEVSRALFNIAYIVFMSEIPMTEDNGETLSFGCGIDFPITFMGIEIDKFMFCFLLGSITGFDTVNVSCSCDIYEGEISPSKEGVGGSGLSNFDYQYWLRTDDTVNLTVTAHAKSGYEFDKWQQSTDGETYTDILDATGNNLVLSFDTTGDYYYKALFKQSE